MRNVDVNFDILKGWENHGDEVSNIFSFIVTDDPSAALENYPYSLTELAKKLGGEHWTYADRIIDRIIEEKGENIKESNNRYHIQVGFTRRYSNNASELLEKARSGDHMKLSFRVFKMIFFIHFNHYEKNNIIRLLCPL